jgi:histidyl-tRNA synthetase
MKTIIHSVKGARDFYPEEMAGRNYVYTLVREVSEAFGYQEYDGPFLETIELYAAKSGEELVKEQSFVFPDRGGELITLRPELTPSLVRMIAQHQNQLVFPLRWWSWGPMWRYERPQKGRSREFFQWNADLIGVDSPEADAELVALIATLFRKAGLTPHQVGVLVNNRRLMDAQLERLGIPKERRPEISRFIDRRDKLPQDKWLAYGQELGLSQEQLNGLMSILENKDLWRESEELVRFFAATRSLGVDEYVRFDPSIVRGLDYYTGTVFEAKELEGDIRRSILGGGRYDNLMADVGGEPLPGVGFAMGDVVFSLILDKYGLLPKGENFMANMALVTVFDQDRLLESFALASELRQAGLKVSVYPEPAKLNKQFKYADRVGMRVAVVLGPDELANNRVTVKDLKNGNQETVHREEAAACIQKLLESAPAS